MQDINVKLWRNQRDQDWSAEINGVRYESVSIDVIEGLVQHALFFGDGSKGQPTAGTTSTSPSQEGLEKTTVPRDLAGLQPLQQATEKLRRIEQKS